MKNYNFNGKSFILNENGQFPENVLIEAFSTALKDIRKETKVSAAKLSKEIGIPQQTLSAYENGTNIPSLLQAIRICAFFQCSIDDFIAYGMGIDTNGIDPAEYYLIMLENRKNIVLDKNEK